MTRDSDHVTYYGVLTAVLLAGCEHAGTPTRSHSPGSRAGIGTRRSPQHWTACPKLLAGLGDLAAGTSSQSKCWGSGESLTPGFPGRGNRPSPCGLQPILQTHKITSRHRDTQILHCYLKALEQRGVTLTLSKWSQSLLLLKRTLWCPDCLYIKILNIKLMFLPQKKFTKF